MNIDQQRQRIIEQLRRLGRTPEPAPRDGTPTPIAVIGMAGRFPQCDSVAALWQALDQDRSLIGEIPADRFDYRAFAADVGSSVRWGGFVPDVRGFDADFFKLTAHEAHLMDPRQRLLLATVYQSLEDAAVAPGRLAGSRTGVFVGAESGDYAHLLAQRGHAVADGLAESMVANRIAHFLDVRGPSEVVNSMCSSAATALHRAVTALRAGEIETAVVAAINLIIDPRLHLALARAGQLSDEATVYSFGAKAAGFLRGEGVAAVVLKPLAAAERDGDPIHAVLRHSAVNYNGRGGLSVAMPNTAAHTALVTRCYREAAIDIRDLSYIEAQGMGNPVADMAEWEAFNRALGQMAEAQGHTLAAGACRIGTLKPMMGHLHAASAMAALFKIIYSFESERLPGILNFETVHPALDMDARPCRLLTESEAWPDAGPRLAALHAYGNGGNNAHIVLQAYRADAGADGVGPWLWPLSAQNKDGLIAKARALHDHLQSHPTLGADAVAATLQQGRDSMPVRALVAGTDRAQLMQRLAEVAAGGDTLAVDAPVAETARAWLDQGDDHVFEGLVAEGTRRAHLPVHRFDNKTYWFDALQSFDDSGDARDALDMVRRLLSPFLQCAPEDVAVDRHFSELGFDSLLAMNLAEAGRRDWGLDLEPALFFDLQTPRELAVYLGENHDGAFQRQAVSAAPVTAGDDAVAIIGVAGRYPGARDLNEMWARLLDGVDCVTEVPRERWGAAWFEPDADRAAASGKSYGKWGGFIDDAYQFDPFFFNISPREASYINPKERLFLQTAWQALEDAGTYPKALADETVGVFVGVTRSGFDPYQTSSFGVANRVSYCFDFNGPSLTIDTACSSSLIAIHEACRQLRTGDCSVAVAGGVHLLLHPSHFAALSMGQFLSPDGKCKSFGAGADGMVPGEGVGAVVLKPLAAAQRDGDPILAVIRASATNHGGKTNGFTVPSAKAHRALIQSALQQSGIDPAEVSYVEAHGTGTSLGDPIELRGLNQAFKPWPAAMGARALGSLKSNMGHLEAAAGVAGLTKVLLQMQHQILVPSLHAAQANPKLDFSRSSFRVQQETAPWQPQNADGRKLPRLACLSSFGAGGANAHVVIEEAPARAETVADHGGSVLLVLSAATEASLQVMATRLANYLAAGSADLAAVAYTLQVGRAPLDERLALWGETPAELIACLRAAAVGDKPATSRRGCVGKAPAETDAASWFQTRDWRALAEYWVAGGVVAWSELYRDPKPARLRLPHYAFAPETYRLPDATTGAPCLHPLVHENRSRLDQLQFATNLSGDEFFLRDHVIGGTAVLPGVAYLEMARAAVVLATDWDAVSLHHIVWAQPLLVTEATTLLVRLTREKHGEGLTFTITGAESAQVYCQGKARPGVAAVSAETDWRRHGDMDAPVMTGATLYDAYRDMAMAYGPAMRAVEQIQTDGRQALIRLVLPDVVASSAASFGLHPSLLDGALQSVLALVAARSEQGAAATAYMPFALESLVLYDAMPAQVDALLRVAEGASAELMKFDLDLFDQQGRAVATLRGFSSRAAAPAEPETAVLHPLVQRAAGGNRWHSRFDGREFFLADHLIGGKKVLPGVAYLEMARVASEAAGLRPVGLKNVVWAQAVVVETQPCDLAIVIETEKRRPGFRVVAAGDGGVLHAQGGLLVGEAPDLPQPAPLDVDAVRTRCGATHGPHAIWGVAEDVVLGDHDAGASFRAMQWLATNDREALAAFQLPACVADGETDYGLHPSLMDVAFETAQFWYRFQTGEAATLLPFSLEALHLYGPLPRQGFAHMKAADVGDGRLRRFDIDLCDQAGKVAIACRGYTAVVDAAGQADQAGDVLYATPTWLPQTLNAASFNDDALVVVAAGESLTQQLRETWPQAQLEVLDNTEVEDVLVRLLALVQAELAGAVRPLAVVVGDDETPVYDAISAFLKTLGNEHPNRVAKLIRVAATLDGDAACIAIGAELAAATRAVDVRLDAAGARSVRTLKPLTPPLAAEPALLPGDVVWITGGLGGLGRLFAAHFAANSGVTVVLSGRSPLGDAQQKLLDPLQAVGKVVYVQADLVDAAQVQALVAEIAAQHGRLRGVIHAAGCLHDAFLRNKTAEEVRAVCAAKVTGTLNVDRALQHSELDWLLLFSSLAAVIGSPGQADYAAANAFLDGFAAARNRRVAQGRATGKTLAVNLPQWRDGGMTMDAASEKMMTQATGLVPLPAAAGVAAVLRLLPAEPDQVLLLHGETAKIEQVFLAAPEATDRPASNTAVPDEAGLERLAVRLKKLVAELQALPEHKIGLDHELSRFGFESISFTHFANELNDRFGLDLMPTVFYEHTSLRQLARHLLGLLPEETPLAQETPAPPVFKTESVVSPAQTGSAKVTAAKENTGRAPVAVIGMAGRFPGGPELDTFWANLAANKDLITDIPPDRWDWRQYHGNPHHTPGQTLIKSAGFIDDIAFFDPMFFGMAPLEAESMDPQFRLFLETVWAAMNDAGVTAQQLAGSRTGVWAGVTTRDYQALLHREERAHGFHMSSLMCHFAVANRVSYLLDLHGPSEAIDTACSSSLVALDHAVAAIQNGTCDTAFAGGVNLIADPDFMVAAGRVGMLSPDGRCKTFDERADGFGRGEGVGVVLLKRLDQALADGDPIHGVIRASAVNHGGKATSPTTPNPVAQQAVLVEAYRRAGITPDQIGYIETHGTGTKLGDPIEVNGLKAAFAELGQAEGDRANCALGSVKANVGHLEAAAGIVGVVKVLLMLKHRRIPGNVHLIKVNPYLKLEQSPFYLPQETLDWPQPQDAAGRLQPRRAGVSSFGIGGTNAHVVLEEYVAPAPAEVAGPFVFVLSARDGDRLQDAARDLHAFLARHAAQPPRLADIAFTLQVGRDAMRERVGFVAARFDEVQYRLAAIAGGQRESGTVYGALNADQDAGTLFADDEDMAAMVDGLLAKRKLKKILELWTRGLQPDWSRLYSATPRRISLPAYPFARQRHWVPSVPQPESVGAVSAPPQASPPADVVETLCFTETWQPRPPQPTHPTETGTWLVFLAGAVDEQRAALQQAQPAARLIVVTPGHDLRQVNPTTYEVNPDRPEALQALLKQLDEPLAGLVYLWPCGGSDWVRDTTVPTALMQAMVAQPLPRLVLAGVFDNPLNRCFLEAWLGFARSSAGIVPRTKVQVLLFSEQTADRAGLLWREIAGDDQAVCYDPHRLLPRLAPLDNAAQPSPLRTKGTYLITGGCGGLGLLFAKHLAQRVGATLILTGRSALDAAKQQALAALADLGGCAEYHQVDVGDASAMAAVLADVGGRHGAVHGVIHAAGLAATTLIHEKTAADFAATLHPKVAGTLVLHDLFAGKTLDFFCLFSSSSAVLGDFGSCDYAVANRFQNAFAAYRRATAAPGKTVAVCWPAWREGGMRLADDDALQLYLKAGGQALLDGAQGLPLFEKLLSGEAAAPLVLRGDRTRVNRFLGLTEAPAAPAPVTTPAVAAAATRPELRGLDTAACVAWDLKEIAGGYLKIERHLLDRNTNLADFGFDSIALAELARRLTDHYDIEITPSLFFGYPTLAKLTEYFMTEQGPAMAAFYAAEPAPDVAAPVVPGEAAPAPQPAAVTAVDADDDPIAVIGMSGRFPQARDVDEMWAILAEGRDAVTEIPADRFDWRRYYGDARTCPDKTNGKWAGFVPGVAEFDPLFFEISPAEAEMMDPRQRLLLQEMWHALEDAAFGPMHLKQQRIGSFVGVENGDYAYVTQSGGFTANHTGILAARLAYFLDLKGPNLAINTACSSSLVAAHQACQSLRYDECDAAIAAGVNLVLAPQTFIGLAQAGMLSDHGKCFAFDERADGMVPGEAAVAVVLKRLSRALADGDTVHGVIVGSAMNHDGRTNGMTAPSGVAQAQLHRALHRRFNINPHDLSYIVTHGTGTKLGDPIEINALNDVLKEAGVAPGSCALTSSKANFGHTFAASGLLSLINLVQAMRHETIPAALHCDTENDFIQWRESPFYVNKENRPWPQQADRARYGQVNSFGMSGTNAALVVRSHSAAPRSTWQAPAYLLVLSAKTEASLRTMVATMAARFEETRVDVGAASYTLLTGRHHFKYRCALVVQDGADAVYLWRRFEGDAPANLLRGTVARGFEERAALRRYGQTLLTQNAAGEAGSDYRENLIALADLYCQGYDLPWAELFGVSKPARISLPGYAFARDAYWAEAREPEAVTPEAAAPRVAPSNPAQWLFLEEAFEAAPIAVDFDWAARVQDLAGRRVLVVCHDEAAGDAVCDLLQRVCTAGNLAAPMVQTLRAEATRDLELPEAPHIVLCLGPAHGTYGLGDLAPARVALQLSRALMKQHWGAPIRLLYLAHQDDDAPCPALDALSAFFRSAMMENELHRWQLIRRAAGTGPDAAQLLLQELLYDEAVAFPLAKTDVFYQQSRRTLRVFAERELTAPRAAPFKSGGVYLFAGAFGYLGELLARELADRYQATLVLLSRSLDGADKAAHIKDLEQRGARVHAYACDIGERESLTATLATVAREVGALNGVINLARTHEDRMIAAKDWDSFARVCHAKVQGTLLLDELTADQTLDFFLCFSSLGAYGVRGSADYAFATAYQNGFARYRNRLRDAGRRHGRALSQCWGAWVEDRLFPESRARIEAQGFSLIDMDRGFPVIEASLAATAPVLLLLSVQDMARVKGFMGLTAALDEAAPAISRQITQWEQSCGAGGLSFTALTEVLSFQEVKALPPALVHRIHRLLFGEEAAAPAQVPPAQAAPIAAPMQPKPTPDAAPVDLAALVRDLLRDVLKLNELDDQEAFPTYGMDSISATVLATRLEQALGHEVPVLWLVEHNTVHALTQQLMSIDAKEQV